MLRLIGLCVAGFLLCSCSGYEVEPPAPKQGRSVPLDKDMEAKVGAVMYSEYNYLSSQTAVTRAPLSYDILLNRVALPAGAVLAKANVDGDDAFCTTNPAYFGPGERRTLCLFDTKHRGVLDRFVVIGPLVSFRYDTEIPYTLQDAPTDPIGYRYELVFEGMEGSNVRIGYREFKVDLVHPADQQDLTYALKAKAPTPVSFRNVKMLINSADDNAIRYRVLSGFGS